MQHKKQKLRSRKRILPAGSDASMSLHWFKDNENPLRKKRRSAANSGPARVSCCG